MSGEPLRWLESAEPPELLALMRVGADELAPPETLARVSERLRASALTNEKSVAPAAAHETSLRPPVATTSFGVKAAASAVLLVVLGLSLHLTLRARSSLPAHIDAPSAQHREPLPDVQRAAPPFAPEVTAPSDTSMLRAGPEEPRASANVAPPPRPARPEDTDATRRLKRSRVQPRDLASVPGVPPNETRLLEARLLEQARKELSARPDHALVLLRDHATQFPASWLEEERAALLIRALVGTGQRLEARTELTKFEARFPGSLHTQRLEHALAEP
ncbi:MAG: hypothetical protein RLZZ450_5 [Pseudomonadota bacterium]|jgi:hypothetical protein